MKNAFTRSVTQVFKGSAKAFQTFPAAIACALAFAIVTMIRIQLDWPQQEPYNFLFNCLHWAFAMGAIFSLTSITAAQSRFNNAKSFLNANLLGIAAALVAFLGLYFFGGTDPQYTESRFAVVSGLAVARVSMAMLVSFLVFIVLAGYPKDRSDFAKSFFMTHKAFFIALLYGLVIMGGLSGVAGAVQALLYNAMSSKVYMYLGTLAGFIAFTIFIGYFPDFRKGKLDENREIAQKQPRFIEILFGYIMIPIVLALTVVLLIWAGKTILSGMGTSFVRLSSIASSFALAGIWLHIMVTHHETEQAKFYRRIYPIAAIIILVFEAWALLVQLEKSGLKLTEYWFALIWIVTVAAAVLLLVIKDKAHQVIVALICIIAVISVLPLVGYHALPVTAQVDRLEGILISQGMLVNEQLQPAEAEPELIVRESITDAVIYLANAEDAKLPSWFDKELAQSDKFKIKFGFDQTWPKREEIYNSGGYLGTSLLLPPEAVDISEYSWAARPQEEFAKGNNYVSFEGVRGSYRIYWTMATKDGIPSLKIMLNDRIVLEQDMNDYIDRITAKFPPGKAESYQATVEDMSLKLETPELKVLLVFEDINISVNPREDIINYWLNLNTLYLKEK